MELFSLLNNSYKRNYDVRIAHSIGMNESLLLNELIYKHDYWEEQKRLEPDGSFFITQSDIERDIALSPKQQTRAMKNIIDLGLVSVKKYGMPAVNYYTINTQAFIDFINSVSTKGTNQYVQKVDTSEDKMSEQVCTKGRTTNGTYTNGTTNGLNTNTSKEEITKEVSEDSSKKEDVFYWIDTNVHKSTEFIEMLKKWFTTQKKKPTIWQLMNKLTKLYKKYPNENQQLDIITNCALNGWQGWEDYTSNKKSSNLYKQEETNSSSWTDIVS